jgi:SAM-dependent methyltransferase
MKLFTYIKYFYFLLDNWDLKIAWYMIREEIRGERKYRINTTGEDELQNLEEKGIDTSHAHIYMPVNFALLEAVFDQLKRGPQTRNHFLDIGCGKGRALCMAAHYGFGKVTGLDFSKELCNMAEDNLTRTAKKFRALKYKVVNNDAFYYGIPEDADCIFLFNPFDEIITSAVVNNIFDSLEANPRKIRVIYVNPLHKELFLNAGYKETWHMQKLRYIEAVILEN